MAHIASCMLDEGESANPPYIAKPSSPLPPMDSVWTSLFYSNYLHVLYTYELFFS